MTDSGGMPEIRPEANWWGPWPGPASSSASSTAGRTTPDVAARTRLFGHGYVRKQAVLSRGVDSARSSLSDQKFEQGAAPGFPPDDLTEARHSYPSDLAPATKETQYAISCQNSNNGRANWNLCNYEELRCTAAQSGGTQKIASGAAWNGLGPASADASFATGWKRQASPRAGRRGTLLPKLGLFAHGCVRNQAVLPPRIDGTRSTSSQLPTLERDAKLGVPLDDVTGACFPCLVDRTPHHGLSGGPGTVPCFGDRGNPMCNFLPELQ